MFFDVQTWNIDTITPLVAYHDQQRDQDAAQPRMPGTRHGTHMAHSR
jgi:hypothetical protein